MIEQLESTEEIITIGAAQSLVGVLTVPAVPAPEAPTPAVILLNAGLIHRVGPNRIYVNIARALAALGFHVLRFDLSGIGESAPPTGHQPVELNALADVREAMRALQQRFGIEQCMLVGHCSGAELSLYIAAQEPCVRGAILINPGEGDEVWGEFDHQRKVANYYEGFYGRAALANRERVVRLLTGRADYRTIANNVYHHIIRNRIATVVFRVRAALGTHQAQSGEQADKRRQAVAILQTVAARGMPLLFIHSEGSTGHQLLRAMIGNEIDALCAAGRAQVSVIPESDHIFNLLASQQQLVTIIEGWMREQCQPQQVFQ